MVRSALGFPKMFGKYALRDIFEQGGKNCAILTLTGKEKKSGIFLPGYGIKIHEKKFITPKPIFK